MKLRHAFGAVFATALVLGVVGIGLAAIPSSNGVISGCFVKKSGAVRVLDAELGQTCKKTEQALNWNQQGPAGTPGAQGAKGDQGPAGISKAFAIDPNRTYGIPLDHVAIIARLNLPAGTYIAMAKTVIHGADNTPIGADCWVGPESEPETRIDMSGITLGPTVSGAVDSGLITLDAAFTLAIPKQMVVRCVGHSHEIPQETGVMGAALMRFTALQVGSLEIQPGT